MDNRRRASYCGGMERTDLLIIGGGLVGPALALAAAQAGLTSRILDRGDGALPDAFDGRAYSLALASRRMLTALGVWSELEPGAQPIHEIKVSDGVAGQGAAPAFAHFQEAELGQGPLGHMVEDRALRRVLAAAAQAAGAVIEHSVEITAQRAEDANGVVTLADGSERRAALIVGADGRGSATARRAGIARNGWSYGQTSLVAALEVERDHGGIAHQMFFPEGPLAVLPLQDRRVVIVWTERTARAEAIAGFDDDAYLEVLRPRFGRFLGKIDLIGGRGSFPLDLSLAARLTGPRLALAGDAAHGIHPLAGQGLNLGFRDVAALAEVLAAAIRRGEDPGAPQVLDRYAAWRRPDIAKLAVATDGINRIFSNANPILRGARVAALGAVGHLPALRRGMMRQAAGIAGPLPRLLAGEAL
ncbi:MAG: FAD-dependent monooxygenase [Pseudomonadota bacterium]